MNVAQGYAVCLETTLGTLAGMRTELAYVADALGGAVVLCKLKVCCIPALDPKDSLRFLNVHQAALRELVQYTGHE